MPTPVQYEVLGVEDVPVLRVLLAVFGEAFGEPDTYGANAPSDAYLRDLLGKAHFIALVAREGHEVVGGLCAYELQKFEQARSEIYIYDLAVREDRRRRGVAKGLIRTLQELAHDRGAWVIFVQADYVDPPAIALYESLGVREEVLHFDLPVRKRP